MTFHEWCEISDRIIGEAGMAVFHRYVNGEISFEECLKEMYEVMPAENMKMLEIFMGIVNGRKTVS